MGVVVFVVIIAIAFGVVCALRSTSAPCKLGLRGLCGALFSCSRGLGGGRRVVKDLESFQSLPPSSLSFFLLLLQTLAERCLHDDQAAPFYTLLPHYATPFFYFIPLLHLSSLSLSLSQGGSFFFSFLESAAEAS